MLDVQNCIVNELDELEKHNIKDKLTIRKSMVSYQYIDLSDVSIMFNSFF